MCGGVEGGRVAGEVDGVGAAADLRIWSCTRSKSRPLGEADEVPEGQACHVAQVQGGGSRVDPFFQEGKQQRGAVCRA